MHIAQAHTHTHTHRTMARHFVDFFALYFSYSNFDGCIYIRVVSIGPMEVGPTEKKLYVQNYRSVMEYIDRNLYVHREWSTVVWWVATMAKKRSLCRSNESDIWEYATGACVIRMNAIAIAHVLHWPEQWWMWNGHSRDSKFFFFFCPAANVQINVKRTVASLPTVGSYFIFILLLSL